MTENQDINTPEEDVEGHKAAFRPLTDEGGEDVEGHKAAFRPLTDEADDDVEGHKYTH